MPVAAALVLSRAAIFADNVHFGLPITLLLRGPEAVVPVTSMVTLDSFVTMGAIIVALQAPADRRARPVAVFARIVRIPILQALAAGGVLNLASAGLPEPVPTFVDVNNGAAPVVALFARGVVLSSIRFRPDAVVWLVTLPKIVAFPAAVTFGLATLALPGWGTRSI